MMLNPKRAVEIKSFGADNNCSVLYNSYRIRGAMEKPNITIIILWER